MSSSEQEMSEITPRAEVRRPPRSRTSSAISTRRPSVGQADDQGSSARATPNEFVVDVDDFETDASQRTEVDLDDGDGEDGDEGEVETDEDDGSGAAELSWKDVKVMSPNGKRILLHNACGRVKGRFLAIMGPSGAGKTSLLNLLACRAKDTPGKGDMMIDGLRYRHNDLKKLSGYVMQDDLLFPYLTVRETLLYAAYLRLPLSIPRREKIRRVEEIMKKLGLEHCQNTRIGDPLKRGISGGERKRLCVGIELLTRPRILFLDEPTSGLDSVTALTVCRILRNLAHSENCTVVCTIHQPSTKIFNLFDDLMVLKHGRMIYHGPVDGVLEYYSNAGFPCPVHTNPADHVLDVITPTAFTPEGIEQADKNAEALLQSYSPAEVERPKRGKLAKAIKFPSRAPWWLQFVYLFQRSIRNALRARMEMIAQFVQTLVMAFLIGGVFWQIGTDQSSNVRRQPVLFFVCINQGIFGALILINSFPSERVIVLRERAAGMYSVSAYYLAKMLAEMILQLPWPFLFACIVYWMVGLQPDVGKFFIFLAFMELCSLAATSLALMISTICRTVTLAITMLPVVLEVCRLFGGFFLSPADLPSYFSWLDALSFVKYTYVGISLNELEGLELYCTPSQLNSSGQCPVTSGQQRIDALGLDFITIWGCALVLIAMTTFFRVVSYIALRFDYVWDYLTYNNCVRFWHSWLRPRLCFICGCDTPRVYNEEEREGGSSLRNNRQAEQQRQAAEQEAELEADA